VPGSTTTSTSTGGTTGGIDAGCSNYNNQSPCFDGGTVCGWDAVGAGPCGLPPRPDNFDCCSGLVCGSSNFCVPDSGS
jgi:hypothetical protein